MQIISIPGRKGADGGGINNQSNNLQLPDLKKDQKGLPNVRQKWWKRHTSRHTFMKFLASVKREKNMYIFFQTDKNIVR